MYPKESGNKGKRWSKERVEEGQNVDKGKEKMEVLEDVSTSRTKAGSVNRFAILEYVAKEQEILIVDSGK